MLSKIYLTEITFEAYSVLSDQPKELDNLSRVNIFVGANNSGKSRFLRNLFADEKLSYQDSRVPLHAANQIISKCKDELLSIVNRTINNSLTRNNTISIIEKHMVVNSKLLLASSEKIDLSRFNSFNIRASFSEISLESSGQENEFRENFTRIYNEAKKQLGKIYNSRTDRFPLKRNYIPILRGLRNVAYSAGFELHNEDVYWKRTKDDYFNEIEFETDRIFTGLNLYKDVKRKLLGKRPDREKIKAFENFLSETFFQGAEINIITPEEGKQITHVYIDDVDWPIHDLGDGVQSIIALTYPMFFNQGEDMVFFIEEPEHCLHPGYQRIFMNVLMRKEFSSFQYFITTHSNHLLDMTLDEKQVSIYTFQKHPTKKTADDKPTFTIENVDNAHTDILELLGVRTSSVFLTNCTIWVEGITDRLYIQKYLEVYQKYYTKNNQNQESEKNSNEEHYPVFKEDLHYSFVEYSGSNITHWSFLEDENSKNKTIEVKRLCSKLMLISDDDGEKYLETKDKPEGKKSKKWQRHATLEKKLGANYCCLPVREIENLLSPDVLKKVIEKYEPNNEKLEILKIEQEKYRHLYLGTYLNNKVKGGKERYKDKNSVAGTLANKLDFARKAVEAIESFDELSPDAKELTIKIYKFIKFHNAGEAANAEN